MSFKNKMKNRGISKLDNLVETPDYITPVQPKKLSWNWLKIAIPVTAGLALVVVPVSVFAINGGFSANSSSKNADYASDSASAPSDPDYSYHGDDSYSPVPEGGNSSAGEADASPAIIDNNFSNLLSDHNILGNYVIEVYDYADGYMEPTYTFGNEEATNIINSISTINSDITTFNNKSNSASANRNTAGYLMGINHRLKIKDGSNYLIANYFSQFATLVVEQSAFDLTGSDAYQIMDAHIEMDYNPTFDETINT